MNSPMTNFKEIFAEQKANVTISEHQYINLLW